MTMTKANFMRANRCDLNDPDCETELDEDNDETATLTGYKGAEKVFIKGKTRLSVTGDKNLSRRPKSIRPVDVSSAPRPRGKT